ncbi:MA20_42120 [Bartonella apihabitans]|uniref:YfbR-like 5'-deoxynucleotidase n=1 Tax=Bartonella TaxID=773 RepID=UPI0018DEBD09|nr:MULTISPECIES: HD family hydrolase [Bartonella]MBH9994729.1 HD family hydrolase [Bartonella sp. P0291]MBH9996926.1 HD family hydrolase [Bartonella sp. M0192]MBH9999086.1 HD family hydrolase [Bartonella sp. M0191]MBI0007466.1 HD family hydrolase [Bartonella sp. M0193]MBI0010377.1 HD family hydrolase [Bartonella sp. M0176]
MADAEITRTGEARAWQRMLSGRRLDLINPSPLDVEITDIAHGLARVARWNGQTKGEYAYSVAQHSLLVEKIYRRLFPEATADEKQLALLHDAPEYVIGDMISPFKAVMGGSYEMIEKRLEDAIRIRFGLPTELRVKIVKQLKQADRIAAYFEASTLAGFSKAEAIRYFGEPETITPQGLDLIARPTPQIEGAFLARFNVIEQERAH